MSDEGLEAAADSLYYDNMELEKEVEVLKAENKRLREDQRRLEWLVENCSEIVGGFVRVQLYVKYMDNWRDAIDAAMKQESVGMHSTDDWRDPRDVAKELQDSIDD